MKKFTKYLVKEFQTERSESITFFRSHKAYGYILWLKLMENYFSNRKISTEKFIEIGSKYASRRTVSKFLIKAEKLNFIEKAISIKDKRVTFILPSKVSVSEYTDWANKFLKSIC